MAIHVWQYPKCGTCKKAEKWLGAHGLTYQKTDLVATPPTEKALEDLWQRAGVPIAKLFNTSGESYRAGNWKERLPRTSEAEALKALAADGKLIKRPLLDTGKKVLVGFDEAAYAETLGKRSGS